MCGIAGICSIHEQLKAEWIKNMTDALKHRGPDDEGYLAVSLQEDAVWPLVGRESKINGKNLEDFTQPVQLLLGHRRLSILDLSSNGHQPMVNPRQDLWITYNGEIYNFIELRQELSLLGHVFITNTDTEVLLAAYEEWGEDCLKKINGMWSFVIYDRKKNVLFGSRDRFGVKPMYYYFDNRFFAFASETKALLTLPFIEKKVNPAAVFDYLVLGLAEHEEEGFFANIFELMPAQAFCYDLKTHKLIKWRYFDLPYCDTWEDYDATQFRSIVAKAKDNIFDAIRLRLRADVSVGTCLSGGLDSSTIVCAINDLLKKKKVSNIGEQQKVFTAYYGVPAVDEEQWAKIVVDHTGADWYKEFIGPHDLLNDIEDLIYFQDVPFFSTSMYAQYRVIKLASQTGVKVLLDGQGGDEVFAGYHVYYLPFFLEMFGKAKYTNLMRELSCLHNSPVSLPFELTALFRQFCSRFLPIPFLQAAQKFIRKENNYINPDFWQRYKSRLEKQREVLLGSLNPMLKKKMAGLGLKTLLRYEDRNSMRFSLESRTPFSDDINLIDFMFRLPSVYKIHEGWSKYVLRQAIQGVVPEAIRTRTDKMGFETPERLWLNNAKDQLRSYLVDKLDVYLDIKKIRNDWDTLISAQRSTGITNIWKYINLAVWQKVYKL